MPLFIDLWHIAPPKYLVAGIFLLLSRPLDLRSRHPGLRIVWYSSHRHWSTASAVPLVAKKVILCVEFGPGSVGICWNMLELNEKNKENHWLDWIWCVFWYVFFKSSREAPADFGPFGPLWLGSTLWGLPGFWAVLLSQRGSCFTFLASNWGKEAFIKALERSWEWRSFLVIISAHLDAPWLIPCFGPVAPGAEDIFYRLRTGRASIRHQARQRQPLGVCDSLWFFPSKLELKGRKGLPYAKV